MKWNIADLYDMAEALIPPQRSAVIEADSGRNLSWGELSRRSNNLAQAFTEMATEPGDKVAIYMRNCIEYIETLIACQKARLVAVNVNYRYREDELRYILDNSDSKIVVYSGEFRDTLQAIRAQLPALSHCVELSDSEDRKLAEAHYYLSLRDSGSGQPLDIQRSAEDLLFVYTGGTTGPPKAVMWPSDTLFRMVGANLFSAAPKIPSDHQAYLHEISQSEGGRTMVPVPLMHGAGLHISQTTLLYGGCVILMGQSGFDAEQLLAALERHRAQNMVIVGDAIAKPLLNALQEHPERWDLSRLQSILSTATVFSLAQKRGLLKHLPQLTIVDTLGASESPSFGRTISTRDNIANAELEMQIKPETKVFNERFEELQPGSDQIGLLAQGGALPLGYYKDAEKTANTYRVIRGVRYAIPGDYAKVLANGKIKLLGRGNVCINSGGEKIFPDEVECAIKQHPSVADAVVVGVPDERWGEAATALLELLPKCSTNTEAIRAVVRERLADYKVPKHVLIVDSVNRGPNGKVDYRALRALAMTQLGLSDQ